MMTKIKNLLVTDSKISFLGLELNDIFCMDLEYAS